MVLPWVWLLLHLSVFQVQIILSLLIAHRKSILTTFCLFQPQTSIPFFATWTVRWINQVRYQIQFEFVEERKSALPLFGGTLKEVILEDYVGSLYSSRRS